MLKFVFTFGVRVGIVSHSGRPKAGIPASTYAII